MDTHEDTERLLQSIRAGIIGDDVALDGPFGRRRVTYADYTASGRSLRFIEDFIREEVLPLYANTHSETSGTGRQTGRFREDARRIIHASVHGGPDDLVIFSGSGATGAIAKVVDCLGLRIPDQLDARWGLSDHIPADQRPVVFIGPYEHHSNELPWRESIADVVVIDEDADGLIDLAHLEAELRRHVDRPLKIGSFSAASNVTGIGSKTGLVSILLHRYGALAFWDFAAAGPYVQMEMNLRLPDHPDGALAYKDAIFLSPHKFIGGPGTPGVLVAKRHVLRNRVPSVPGGGTVSYVSHDHHRYLDDPVHREEGGTPAIVESIRAGLVFQLKEAVGAGNIRTLEHDLTRRAIDAWSRHPNIRILGNRDAWRLSIVSFVVRYDDGSDAETYLHHNFVVALLNDLFGIQARGGCSCAGPYGHRLLGIGLTRSRAFEEVIACGFEGVKPGWVRVNFNYFINRATFDYIVEAVAMVAEHGWKLLPDYTFEPVSGLWRHRAAQSRSDLSLDDLDYAAGALQWPSRRATEPSRALARYLAEARAVFDAVTPRDTGVTELTDEGFRKLRWFPLPEEAAARLSPA